MNEARLKELGVEGMMGPLKTTCANHTGNAGAWMVEWDGETFVKVSELLSADRALIDPLVESEAKKYAEANAPWPMNEECQM
jgi:branched-chain amino acid transport system substrate-binding protein